MAWEDVKDILRPQNVHMGKMAVDEAIPNSNRMVWFPVNTGRLHGSETDGKILK